MSAYEYATRAACTMDAAKDESRVSVAVIDRATLAEFRQLEVEILANGQITGICGVLLGLAAAAGLPGGCLSGEIPHVFSQQEFKRLGLFQEFEDRLLDLFKKPG